MGGDNMLFTVVGLVAAACLCLIICFSCFLTGAQYDEANERQRKEQENKNRTRNDK